MDAATATLLELEVLDHVGDVRLAACDPGGIEPTVELLAGRADERLALAVLLVAGLLAHEHQPRALQPFAEDGLGGAPPQVAAAAASGSIPQCLQAPPLRQERRCIVRLGLGVDERDLLHGPVYGPARASLLLRESRCPSPSPSAISNARYGRVPARRPCGRPCRAAGKRCTKGRAGARGPGARAHVARPSGGASGTTARARSERSATIGAREAARLQRPASRSRAGATSSWRWPATPTS